MKLALSYFPITSQPAQLFVSEENSWTKTLISYPLSLLGSQNTKRKKHKPSLFFCLLFYKGNAVSHYAPIMLFSLDKMISNI